MFNKIQNHLLLRHPLLWNIKIVPMLAITLGIHLFFFLIGFAKGSLNFTSSRNGYSYDDNIPVIIFFSVVLSIIVLILWLVYYFRNNAFKSFYPKNKASLYKEWLLILFICILNFSYTATFMWGQDVRRTSYFTDDELHHRLDVISMVSLFTEAATTTIEATDAVVAPATDSLTATYVNNRRPISLYDKSINGFGTRYYRDRAKDYSRIDSINNLRVQSWLQKDQRDSVLWLFTEFEKIAKSHGLKGNITPQQWLNLVYHSPEFTQYEYIAGSDGSEDDLGYRYSNFHRNAQYFVPYKPLRHNYEEIFESEYKPFIDKNTLVAYLIAGFSFSLFIFSFRVTSGRGWLIALVSIGIAALLVGLLAVMFRSVTSYSVIWLMIITGVAVYYFATASQKEGKGITDTVLNCVIWLFSSIIPLISGIIIASHEYDYNLVEQPHTFANWLEDNIGEMLYINLLFIMVYMFFLTLSIKKWKGIAES